MKYAVIKQWRDNPDDLAVWEYFNSIEECQDYIKKQQKSPLFDWGVAEYK